MTPINCACNSVVGLLFGLEIDHHSLPIHFCRASFTAWQCISVLCFFFLYQLNCLLVLHPQTSEPQCQRDWDPLLVDFCGSRNSFLKSFVGVRHANVEEIWLYYE